MDCTSSTLQKTASISMLQHCQRALDRLHQPATHPIGFVFFCAPQNRSPPGSIREPSEPNRISPFGHRRCSELFLLRGSHAAKTCWQGSSYSLRALECHSHAGLGAVGISRLASVGLLHVSRSCNCRLYGRLAGYPAAYIIRDSLRLPYPYRYRYTIGAEEDV